MLMERRREIVDKIQKNRMVKVAELMKEYDVSIETIRRDLEDLEKKGLLKRVYGGAVIDGMYGEEPAYEHREVIHPMEKKAIAAAAAPLVEDGDTLFFDVGTSTLELARRLGDKRNLTVITNSTPIATEIVKNPGHNVILLGGVLRLGDLSVSGFLAEQNIGQFYANKLIMGIGGITAKNGVTDYHTQEANIRRLMLERCDRVIGLADHSKFGVTAMNVVCPVSRIHDLVTDAATPKEMVEEIRDCGAEVIVAPEPDAG